MKKVCIIGANSYIARNLVYKLQKDLPKVCLFLYDINQKQSENVEPYQQIDLSDRTTLLRINFDCDVVYYFSAKTGTVNSFKDYKTFIDVNEIGLLNFLDTYVEKKSNAKIIFPSTRLLYKGSKTPINEDSELEFKTIYSINKFCGEKYLEMYSNLYGCDYAVLRISIPYGSFVPLKHTYGIVGIFLKKAQNGEDIEIYGNGKQKRSFVYINDLCRALLVAAKCRKISKGVFNVGGADHISIVDVARIIAEHYCVKVNHIKWPPLFNRIETGDSVIDSSKFDKLCNFNYKNRIKETLFSDYNQGNNFII